MPWLIGIDEAGYGPNLGPFVMTAVACQAPAEHTQADLWRLLASAVRRPGEADDERLLIEDSKLVYSQKDGLACLERGVHGSGVVASLNSACTFTEFLRTLTPTGSDELCGERWFTGTTVLPLAAAWETIAGARARFHAASAAVGMSWGCVRSVVVCPTRFNQVLDRWDTKGAVLGQALAELLQAILATAAEDEPLTLHVDKHGGRNTYAAMLSDAVPLAFVMTHEESAQRSTYSLQGLGRAVQITFQPRADAEHFCVALASMVSKYVRELLMHEFNAFWQQHVPGLQPTAGYPSDAKRYWTAIQPVVARLGISEHAIWRRK